MSILAQLLREHQTSFIQQFASRMNTEHYRAMSAILRCHTPECGFIQSRCTSCDFLSERCRSCGHRSCPECQFGAQQQWLLRQQQKQLPVTYYMATFTLPAEWRGFAFTHQVFTYNLLFECAVATLRQFAVNDPKLGNSLGMTGVLHTHSRQLDYHPHVHFILPGGGYDARHRSWLDNRRRYLFNGKALAKVFRGKFIAAMIDAGFSIPKGKKPWVAHAKAVGQGEKALQYLSHYLYRGVIGDRNILKTDEQSVTFQYRDSRTQKKTRKTLPVLAFLWKVLQHVLPRGFRRARDYGFLHGNAKAMMAQIRKALRFVLPPIKVPEKAKPCCPQCGHIMQFIKVIYHSLAPLGQTTN
jgi:hypothetical protein